MLILFVILLIFLKGISVLNTKFIAYLAKTETVSRKEIVELLAQQTEKSPKLVAIHKKSPVFIEQQVA